MPPSLRLGGIFKNFSGAMKDFNCVMDVMDIISEKLFGRARSDRTRRLKRSCAITAHGGNSLRKRRAGRRIGIGRRKDISPCYITVVGN